MAKFNNLKIRLLTKPWSTWDTTSASYIPAKGEVCISTLSPMVSTELGVSTLIKVGDGERPYSDLDYIGAYALDVMAWAKREAPQFTDFQGEFISDLDEHIDELIENAITNKADTVYVDAKIADVNTSINTVKSELNEEIDAVQTDLASEVTRATNVESSLSTSKQDKITVENKLSYNLLSDTPNLDIYALTNSEIVDIELDLNTETYQLSASVKRKDGTSMYSNTIDLPIEELVVSGRYINTTKSIELVLKNQSVITIPVGDLVDGLVSIHRLEETLQDYPLKTDLAEVARSGNYNDLSNKPTIPAAQVNSDWDATEGKAAILNKPTIPTVPTNVSAFTNDMHYLTKDNAKQILVKRVNESEEYVSTIDNSSIPGFISIKSENNSGEDFPTIYSSIGLDSHGISLTSRQTEGEDIYFNRIVVGSLEHSGDIMIETDDNHTVFINDVDVSTYLTEHQDISGKQDVLTTGVGIDITDNVISVTGQPWEKGAGLNSTQTVQSEVNKNNAAGEASVSEGAATDAHSFASHAEGYMTSTGTSAQYSHAEGYKTSTQGVASHAEGDNTVTNNPAEHAEGRYNKSNMGGTDATNTISSIGIGDGSTEIPGGNRKNAVEVMQNGDTYIINVGGYNGSNFEDAQTVQEVISSKQSTLTPGKGITITNNKISIDEVTFAEVDYVDASISDTMNFIIQERDTEHAGRVAGDELLQTAINTKQDKLTTGNGIDITNNIISSTITGIPTYPAENGIYILQVTIDSGIPTLEWVVKE